VALNTITPNKYQHNIMTYWCDGGISIFLHIDMKRKEDI
jgi:hypothetical protein